MDPNSIVTMATIPFPSRMHDPQDRAFQIAFGGKSTSICRSFGPLTPLHNVPCYLFVPPHVVGSGCIRKNQDINPTAMPRDRVLSGWPLEFQDHCLG